MNRVTVLSPKKRASVSEHPRVVSCRTNEACINEDICSNAEGEEGPDAAGEERERDREEKGWTENGDAFKGADESKRASIIMC